MISCTYCRKNGILRSYSCCRVRGKSDLTHLKKIVSKSSMDRSTDPQSKEIVGNRPSYAHF